MSSKSAWSETKPRARASSRTSLRRGSKLDSSCLPGHSLPLPLFPHSSLYICSTSAMSQSIDSTAPATSTAGSTYTIDLQRPSFACVVCSCDLALQDEVSYTRSTFKLVS